MSDNANPIVELATSQGTIVLELYPEKAPATVENFLNYVDSGFFDETVFHRVIRGFMVQGGGLTEDMNQKAGNAPIRNEADNGLKNETGTVAMARTAVPDSATSQFFINVKDNDFLNFQSKTQSGWGYCVFGRVIEGMDVVHNIEGVQTGNRGGHQDVPVEPVHIASAKQRSA